VPRKRTPPAPAAECPQCGATFPAGRRACPSCGSDAETGWKSGDEVEYQSLDVPDAFDEDDYRAAIEGLHPADVSKWSSRKVRMFVVGIVLLAAMIVPALFALARMWR
jgi:hypothetical protein